MKARFQLFAALVYTAIIVVGFGLAIAILVSDVVYPNGKRFSLCHSFALLMSLWLALGQITSIVGRQVFIWTRYHAEKHDARRPASQRQRRGSGSRYSRRSNRVASNGVV